MHSPFTPNKKQQSLRYYTKPLDNSSVLQNQPGNPTVPRYSRFHPMPPNILAGNLILSRVGEMKRNDPGWDGVKLKEYVTEKISDDYKASCEALEKFRKEGEENRKNKKHAHIGFNPSLPSKDQSPVRLLQNASSSPRQKLLPSPPQTILPPLTSYSEVEQESEVSFHNIGVNANLLPQVSTQPNKNYLRLQNKYSEVKKKYQKIMKDKIKLSKNRLKNIEEELLHIEDRIDKNQMIMKLKLQECERKNEKIQELQEQILSLKKHKHTFSQKQKTKNSLVHPIKPPKTGCKTEPNEILSTHSRQKTQKPTVVYTIRKNLSNNIFKSEDKNTLIQ